jgi:hypothetical protein
MAVFGRLGPIGDIYKITTTAALALDVSGGVTGNDAPVIQWPQNGGGNQQWRVVPASTDP